MRGSQLRGDREDTSPNRPPSGSSADLGDLSTPARTISPTSPANSTSLNHGRKTIHAHQSQTVGLDPLSVSVYKMKMANANAGGSLGRSQLGSSFGNGNGYGYGNDRTGFDLGNGFDLEGVEEFGYGASAGIGNQSLRA